MPFLRSKLLLLCLTFIMLLPENYFAQGADLLGLEKKLANATTAEMLFDAQKALYDAYLLVDISKCEFYANQLLKTASELNTPDFYYLAHRAWSELALKKNDCKQLFIHDSLAIFFADQKRDEAAQFKALIKCATHLHGCAMKSKSEVYLKLAEILAQKANNTEQIAEINFIRGGHLAQGMSFRKSIGYSVAAMKGFESVGNLKEANRAKSAMAWALIEICKEDSAIILLEQLMQYYENDNSDLMGQLSNYGVLAKAYSQNGNFKRAIEAYEKIRTFFKQYGDNTGFAIGGIDLAGLYLMLKDFTKAKQLLDEGYPIAKQSNNVLALAAAELEYANYYSLIGKNKVAEKHFNRTKNLLPQVFVPDVEIAYHSSLASHYYRNDSTSLGDSLMLVYAIKVSENKDRASMDCALNSIKEKNPKLNPQAMELMKMLFEKGGNKKLKELLKAKPISELLSVYSLEINPYSLGDSIYNANAELISNMQMMELEEKYKSRALQDSVAIKQMELSIASQVDKTKTAWLWASLGIIVLVGVIAYLQIRSRRRAQENERIMKKDKETIAMLKDEVHHNVKNNLALIISLVELTEKKEKVDLNVLKSRVAAIQQLHETLYKVDSNGLVDMKAYFTALCECIQSMFDRSVSIYISSDLLLPQFIAENIGRIVGELITNSFKYAFSDIQSPEIHVSLVRGENGLIELQQRDNGVGLIQNARNGFGKKFIHATVSASLKGECKFFNENGLHFQLSFFE